MTDDTELKKVQAELQNERFNRVFDKLDTMSTVMEAGFADVRRVLEDYEDRLRRQAERDTEQAKQIQELQLGLKDTRGELAIMQNSMLDLDAAMNHGIDKEIDRWDDFKWTLLKFSVIGIILIGAALGGTVGVSKLLLGLL